MLRDLIRHFGDDFLLDVFVDVCIFAGRVHTIYIYRFVIDTRFTIGVLLTFRYYCLEIKDLQ